jgi:monothiol glutaredoxin
MPLTNQQRAEFDKLVRSHQTLLFMKGNRQFPQCGFSATVVGILDKVTSGYETVNVLEDASVREGMKEFSSWPTFPQLYVRGEFVGGCDIVKEMHSSGELQELFQVDREAPKAPRVTVTAAAAKAFQEAIAGGGDVIRLEIDANYECQLLVGAKERGDLEVASNGVPLYIAQGSASRAEGITIDFVETPQGMAFKIENPNEPPRVRPIGPKELKALLDAGRVELFDVRPDNERAKASIAQAKKLDAEGQEYLLGLEKDAVLVKNSSLRVRAPATRLRPPPTAPTVRILR